MYSDEDKLNDEQVETLVKALIKRTRGNINVDRNSSFYDNLQMTTSEIGYIERPKYTQSILSYQDTLNCIERLWQYVLEGVLAPGSANPGYNFYFPYLHITKKGQKVVEEW